MALDVGVEKRELAAQTQLLPGDADDCELDQEIAISSGRDRRRHIANQKIAARRPLGGFQRKELVNLHRRAESRNINGGLGRRPRHAQDLKARPGSTPARGVLSFSAETGRAVNVEGEPKPLSFKPAMIVKAKAAPSYFLPDLECALEKALAKFVGACSVHLSADAKRLYAAEMKAKGMKLALGGGWCRDGVAVVRVVRRQPLLQRRRRGGRRRDPEAPRAAARKF